MSLTLTPHLEVYVAPLLWIIKLVHAHETSTPAHASHTNEPDAMRKIPPFALTIIVQTTCNHTDTLHTSFHDRAGQKCTFSEHFDYELSSVRHQTTLVFLRHMRMGLPCMVSCLSTLKSLPYEFEAVICSRNSRMVISSFAYRTRSLHRTVTHLCRCWTVLRMLGGLKLV